MKPWLSPILAAAVALAAGACTPDPGSSGGHVLRYASLYPPTNPFSRADSAWMRYVETQSRGRLRFQVSWAGSLLSAQHNLVDLRHGIADVAAVTPIYSLGGTHAIRTQSGFYGGERSIDEQIAVYKCLDAGFPVLREEMKGLHVLAVQGGNVLSIITREKPVRTLEDLRGMRLRVPSELIPTLRRLGADPIDMPMSEVYSAMAKGVVDGVVAPGDTLKSLHFGEVAKYFNLVRISRGGYPARAISRASLERLPPDLQELLKESQAFWEAAIARELVKAQEAGLDYGRSQGMSFVAFDPASQRTLDAMYNEQARRTAEAATRYGFDAPAMFRSAQSAIRRLRSGQRPTCAHDEHG